MMVVGARFLFFRVCFCCYMLLFLLCLFSLAAADSSRHNRWALRPVTGIRHFWFPMPYYNVTLWTDKECSRSLKSLNFPKFGFGLLQTDSFEDNSFTLGVLMTHNITLILDVEFVWLSNAPRFVGRNASFGLTDGDLVLKDADGSLVWSTNTSSRQAKSMALRCDGNLVLVNDAGGVVWQSFDHPSDTWLPSQTLKVGQRLTSSASDSNYSQGFFYLSVEKHGLVAYANTTPPANYSDSPSSYNCADGECFKIEGNQTTFLGTGDDNFTYLRLEPDGRLKLFLYKEGKEYLDDLFRISDCEYPMTCGRYGLCSSNLGDYACVCPEGPKDNWKYFQYVNNSAPKSGCVLKKPFSCASDTNKTSTYDFIQLDNVTYFDFQPVLFQVQDHECQKACLESCSCKAAIFHYGENISLGNCSLPSEVLTLDHLNPLYSTYNSIAFIKVKKPPERGIASSLLTKLLPSVFGGLLLMFVCAGTCYYKTVLKRKNALAEIECSSDLLIDKVSGFSFEELSLATNDFQNKLGHGGFGSVFQGTLKDGTEVAVKRLDDSLGQGRKEFLAEVNSIGNLHHFNLVRLIGFCDAGLHRVLVYEYMQNGSLDKWIFKQDLAWSLRSKIIVGIAKGLEYLHENCHQNVIHFDIKPQNILLDKDFNVKIADFGLAKMVERDQNQVLTVLRETPGYIAPELVNGGAISVKVDVYSFGVLVLEIVCGRRNFGSSEDDCLVNMVKLKSDGDRLCDLVDKRTVDIEHHIDEAVKMLKIATWCLQPHFIRPTMSTVVKVLQDVPDMDALTDLSYLTKLHDTTAVVNSLNYSICPTDSLLSGPR